MRLAGRLQASGLASQDVGRLLALRASDEDVSQDAPLRIDIGPPVDAAGTNTPLLLP